MKLKHQVLLIVLLVGGIAPIIGHGLAPMTLVACGRSQRPITCLFHSPHPSKVKVSSYSFNRGTIAPAALTAVGQGLSNCYFHLRFDDNPANDILCTPTQEFYVVKANRWFPTFHLRSGDELLSACGSSTLKSIEFIKSPLRVYALEVKEKHNFFVGPYAIVTHNTAIPWVLSAGIGISFGTGAIAGGSAGSFFGPITFVGGAAIGGIVGIAIKMIIEDRKAYYRLRFDRDIIDSQFTINREDNDKEFKLGHIGRGLVSAAGGSPQGPKKDKNKGKKKGEGIKVHRIQQEPLEWASGHYHKHKPPPNVEWKNLIESTTHHNALYKPGINIERLERHAWEYGQEVANGKNWKVFKSDEIIGAKWGKETQYMRIECSGNAIHGHPILEAEYLKYLKKK